jgi:hypothetical protein
MIVCPFCHYNNEDGALFCEQCKSDLAGVEPVATAAPMVAEPMVAEPIAAEPIVAEAVVAEAIVAEPVEATPVEAEVVEAAPVEAVVAEAVVAEAVVAEPVVEAPPPPPPAPPAPPPPPAPAPVAAAPAPAAAGAVSEVPAGANVRLVVLRGQKPKAEFPVYEGQNFIGRADEKPVDIDLEDQEPPDRVWSSRQHALITYENNKLQIEDLNSSNGTFVNRARIYPGQPKQLNLNDVIQIGNVQLKVLF